MFPSEPSGPDIDGVIADANAVDLRLRDDKVLTAEDVAGAHHLRVKAATASST